MNASSPDLAPQADNDGRRKLIETELVILLHPDAENRLRQEAAERAEDGTENSAALARYLSACADGLSAVSNSVAERYGNEDTEQLAHIRTRFWRNRAR